ncbi:hypothetical protein [Paraburkholderia xenovorans]
MNCKLGDMACVVRIPDCAPDVKAALEAQLVGRFVRCVALATECAASWLIETPIALAVPCWPTTVEMTLTAIEDFCLQPVRGVPVHDEQLDEVTA